MNAALASPHDWIVADQVLFETYKALRHLRIFTHPLSAAEAEQIRFFGEESGSMVCAYELSLRRHLRRAVSSNLDCGRFDVDYLSMASLSNPFPGMNPWMEQVWGDCHTKLISYICDALGEQLPDDLAAVAEVNVSLSGPLEGEQDRRLDVGFIENESWKQGSHSQWSPETDSGTTERLAEPVIVPLDEVTPRWVEIRSSKGKLITVIEVTSPANKSLAGRIFFEKKMEDLLHGGVNVMEIDLIRGGHTTRELVKGSWPDELYEVVVRRAGIPHHCEVYPCPLRKPLPAVGVPLRAGESDVVLDLQPLIDRCYQRGRYWLLLRYEEIPAALSEADLAWTREILKND